MKENYQIYQINTLNFKEITILIIIDWSVTEEFLKKLGFGEEIEIRENKENIPQNAVSIVSSNLELFIPFEDLVDIKEEIERLEKEKAKVLVEKEKTEKMLSNPGFVAKAPAAKVEEEKEKQAKFNEMIKTIEERIAGLK